MDLRRRIWSAGMSPTFMILGTADSFPIASDGDVLEKGRFRGRTKSLPR